MRSTTPKSFAQIKRHDQDDGLENIPDDIVRPKTTKIGKGIVQNRMT